MPGLVQELPAVSALAEIATAVTAAARPQSLLKILAVRTARACGVERCSILLCRDGTLVPAMSQFASGVAKADDWVAFKALGPFRLADFHALARAVARDVIVVDDAAAVLPRPLVERFDVSTFCLAPLFRQRRLVGLIVFDNHGAPITEAQIVRARAVAGTIGAAIGTALSSAETRRRVRANETLLNVGQAIGSTLELPEVARRITREAARALSADSAGIYLADESGTLMEPFAAYHMPKRYVDTMRREPIALRQLSQVFEGTRWSDDVPTDPAFEHPIFKKFPMQSLVVTPLRIKSRVVGVLVCAWWTKRRRLRREEVRLIEGIAAQAAMAIVNANLYAEAEQLAVNRERLRVTEELHDTLSRVLFSIALKVDRCLQQLPADSELKPHIEAIKWDARSMMTHLRRVILQLSSPEGAGGGLARLVQDFQDLSGIPVLFVEHGDLSRLDEMRRDLLERAIREALANVVKHARASRVECRVDLGPDSVEFEVADDGVGLSVPNGRRPAAPGHYGLRQMRDRLTAVGGDVQLGSNAPSGLRLKGRFPIR